LVAEFRDAGDAHEWLRRARSNFARAAADPAHPDILLEDLCFDAQQAAEKAIKAVLVHRRIRFPRTHAIADLLSLAAENGVQIPPDVLVATDLTTHAVYNLARIHSSLRVTPAMAAGSRIGCGT
jgi:HEPN domain-containing protein